MPVIASRERRQPVWHAGKLMDLFTAKILIGRAGQMYKKLHSLTNCSSIWNNSCRLNRPLHSLTLVVRQERRSWGSRCFLLGL